MAKQDGPCPKCAGATLIVTIRALGEHLSIVFCPDCGHRQWASERESLRLEQVIARFREASDR